MAVGSIFETKTMLALQTRIKISDAIWLSYTKAIHKYNNRTQFIKTQDNENTASQRELLSTTYLSFNTG